MDVVGVASSVGSPLLDLKDAVVGYGSEGYVEEDNAQESIVVSVVVVGGVAYVVHAGDAVHVGVVVVVWIVVGVVTEEGQLFPVVADAHPGIYSICM